MRVSRKVTIPDLFEQLSRKGISVPAAPMAGGGSGSTDWGIVESLPVGVVIGDRCTYKVALGTYWELLYTGEATYPWAKVGGSPLRQAPVASRNTSSTTYQSTGSPSVTAPLAMEGAVSFGAALMANQVAEANEMRIAAFKAATEIDWCGAVATSQFAGPPAFKRAPAATLAKGEAVTTRYKSVSGKSSTFHNLYVEVDPIRVG
jgi:hypothetical protein